MKCLTLVCSFVLLAATLARPEEYTHKYDGMDLDKILDNRRLLIPYIHCLLDEGICTPDGKELKSHIREALENDCAKCSQKQRSGAFRVMKHLYHNEPDFWKRLTDKYDPTLVYFKKYENEITAQ